MADSRSIHLSDPEVPESRQPYHAGLGTARASGRGLSRLVSSVERFGRRSVSAVVRSYQSEGRRLRGAGVVVGSLIDPERIANDHIRIHALEGRLFRQVVEYGAIRNGLACSVWRERDLYALAVQVLERREPAIRDSLTRLGRTVDGPWRMEQKAAALAAWIVLTRRGRPPAERHRSAC